MGARSWWKRHRPLSDDKIFRIFSPTLHYPKSKKLPYGFLESFESATTVRAAAVGTRAMTGTGAREPGFELGNLLLDHSDALSLADALRLGLLRRKREQRSS